MDLSEIDRQLVERGWDPFPLFPCNTLLNKHKSISLSVSLLLDKLCKITKSNVVVHPVVVNEFTSIDLAIEQQQALQTQLTMALKELKIDSINDCKSDASRPKAHPQPIKDNLDHKHKAQVAPVASVAPVAPVANWMRKGEKRVWSVKWKDHVCTCGPVSEDAELDGKWMSNYVENAACTTWPELAKLYKQGMMLTSLSAHSRSINIVNAGQLALVTVVNSSVERVRFWQKIANADALITAITLVKKEMNGNATTAHALITATTRVKKEMDGNAIVSAHLHPLHVCVCAVCLSVKSTQFFSFDKPVFVYITNQ